ncbi:hypothetical protein ACTFIW_009888 [Dictyostelium discoideum]
MEANSNGGGSSNSFLDLKKEGNSSNGGEKVFVTIGQHKLDLKMKSARTSNIPDLQDISIEHQPPPPPCPYDHLVLVVHGIGKHDSGYFEMIEKLNKKFDKMFAYGSSCGMKRVKFIAIEWHSVIREDLGTIIQDVTPASTHAKSLPKAIRAAIDDSFMDYVLFNDFEFSKKIYAEVTDQLNNQYMEFLKTYPAFDGKVSLYSHSLGSLICYDILTNQPTDALCKSDDQRQFVKDGDSNIASWKKFRASQLHQEKLQHLDVNPIKREFKHPHSSTFLPLVFQTYNLFTTGSPIGIICGLRRYNHFPIPSAINWFNIYNICDPVAYLVEPLVDKSFKQLPTYFLPKFRTGSKKKGNNNNGDSSSEDELESLFINKRSSSTLTDEVNGNNYNSNNSNVDQPPQQQQQSQQQPQNPDSSKDEKPFSNYRFDYAIKPTGIHISEYSPLLTAHSDYWMAGNVLYFIGNSLK